MKSFSEFLGEKKEGKVKKHLKNIGASAIMLSQMFNLANTLSMSPSYGKIHARLFGTPMQEYHAYAQQFVQKDKSGKHVINLDLMNDDEIKNLNALHRKAQMFLSKKQ